MYRFTIGPSEQVPDEVSVDIYPFQYNHEDGVTATIKATKVANKRLANALAQARPGRWVLQTNNTFTWTHSYGR